MLGLPSPWPWTGLGQSRVGELFARSRMASCHGTEAKPKPKAKSTADSTFDVWLEKLSSRFRELSSQERIKTLHCLLGISDHQQLAYLSQRLVETICRDFIGWLPLEIAHLILAFLDLQSVLTCCQVICAKLRSASSGN